MKNKLYVIVEGGVVQGVCSDNPTAFKDVEVVLVDYDTDGMPDDEQDVVRFKDDSEEGASAAVVNVEEADIVGIDFYDGKAAAASVELFK